MKGPQYFKGCPLTDYHLDQSHPSLLLARFHTSTPWLICSTDPTHLEISSDWHFSGFLRKFLLRRLHSIIWVWWCIQYRLAVFQPICNLLTFLWDQAGNTEHLHSHAEFWVRCQSKTLLPDAWLILSPFDDSCNHLRKLLYDSFSG